MTGAKSKLLMRFALCLVVASALPARAQDAPYERPVELSGGVSTDPPGGLEMAGDALVGRPLLLAATAVGAATFLASLPFSILGRNVGEAADTLVGGPMRATFARCLGCTRPAQATHSSQSRSFGGSYDTF